MINRLVVTALVACCAANSASAQLGCARLVVRATSASRTADAARVVAAAPGQLVTRRQISKVMVDGPWRLVWATPTNAERGVYFFRRSAAGKYQLVGTWGGVLTGAERQDGITWARQLPGGAPPQRLAECFANAVIAGN